MDKAYRAELESLLKQAEPGDCLCMGELLPGISKVEVEWVLQEAVPGPSFTKYLFDVQFMGVGMGSRVLIVSDQGIASMPGEVM